MQVVQNIYTGREECHKEELTVIGPEIPMVDEYRKNSIGVLERFLSTFLEGY